MLAITLANRRRLRIEVKSGTSFWRRQHLICLGVESAYVERCMIRLKTRGQPIELRLQRQTLIEPQGWQTVERVEFRNRARRIGWITDDERLEAATEKTAILP